MGILQTLINRDVPIDFVGGVSIGSLIGGLYCVDPDVNRATQKAREWFVVRKNFLSVKRHGDKPSNFRI